MANSERPIALVPGVLQAAALVEWGQAMAIRDVVLYAEQRGVLRRKSRPVHAVDFRARKVIRDLKDTLYSCPDGIGLAAPQIGVHLRIVVVRLGSEREDQAEPDPPMVLVNPAILRAGGEHMDFDGCLSFPGLYAETVRPHYLEVEGRNELGVEVRWTFEGFDAVLAHHEIDHLDGILFVDRVERPTDFFTIGFDRRGIPHRRPVVLRRRGRELVIPPTLRWSDSVPCESRTGHDMRCALRR